jgi:hypothetical protein
MDFKKLCNLWIGLVMLSFTVLFFSGCSNNNKEKSNTDNTFYIELVNFTNDSLKQTLSNNFFGKATYYKNDKLQILSVNYLTDDLPEMHYFKNADILGKNIADDTRKIRIEFKGNFSLDSIKYSLQKFRYNNKQWIKTSDMGEIKETKKFVQPQSIFNEFVRMIVLNTIEYSYN